MIYVGIDDTDMPDTPGTNQLARALISHVATKFRCQFVLRHQLLYDRRIPYTSKNGSASIQFEPVGEPSGDLVELIGELRARMLAWYVPGSDPGLCVSTTVPDEIVRFGYRCQHEIVRREDAEQLALEHKIHLEGLGGTRGGMIGALAAIGLASTRNDGRVVVNGEWPDDLSGRQAISLIESRGVAVQRLDSGEQIRDGIVDVGKHLRPNIRNGQVIQFVQAVETAEGPEWQAVRLT